MEMAAAGFKKLQRGRREAHDRPHRRRPPTPSSTSSSACGRQGVKVTTVAVGNGTSRSSPRSPPAAAASFTTCRTRGPPADLPARSPPRRPAARLRAAATGDAARRSPDNEILRGLDGGVPPITGLVLTHVKENPLVEVLLRSPLPATPNNATLLATWTYGAGKAVALTTDAGTRWASAWTEWEGYDKFFAQIVRWAMRPTGDTGNFTVATDVRDGKTEIVVTALDAEENFLNKQSITAAAIAPDMSTIPIAIEQVAPAATSASSPPSKPAAT